MIRLTDQVTDAELDELKARGELVYKYGPQVWALKTARRDMRNHNLRKFINKHGLFLNTGVFTMSLAADVLKAGTPKPRRVVDTGNFQYSTGYAFRKPRGRQGVLTWRIPLAQITHAFNVEGAKEIVWPWVDDNPDVRLRQVAQVHHRAKREGWLIRTRRVTGGIRIAYLGERARAKTKRAGRGRAK